VIESWTLDWDEETKTLSKMRSKETVDDYRYFKEPDLLAVKLAEERIQEILTSLPELPHQRNERFIKEYKLSPKEATTLTNERDLANYFEELLQVYGGEPKTAANWVINDLLGLVNELNLPLDKLYLTPTRLAEIIQLVDTNKINTSTGRELVQITEQRKEEPVEIVEQDGLAQLTDTSAIEAICQEVMEASPDQVAQYRSGKKGVIGWFMGQVMSKSGGKADPQVVRELLIKYLEQ
jgi:aspartyl-tRNA(Asn)/glutamyl-tRNA(Gln) amidotransferase subunit B